MTIKMNILTHFSITLKLIKFPTVSRANYQNKKNKIFYTTKVPILKDLSNELWKKFLLYNNKEDKHTNIEFDNVVINIYIYF